MFLGHGHWLKGPMQIRGINNTNNQKDICYAMIYLFNEMMIEIGGSFNTEEYHPVSHIDSRGSVGEDGWTDELHPKPTHFIKTGRLFIDCINQTVKPAYENVYVVNPNQNKL